MTTIPKISNSLEYGKKAHQLGELLAPLQIFDCVANAILYVSHWITATTTITESLRNFEFHCEHFFSPLPPTSPIKLVAKSLFRHEGHSPKVRVFIFSTSTLNSNFVPFIPNRSTVCQTSNCTHVSYNHVIHHVYSFSYIILSMTAQFTLTIQRWTNGEGRLSSPL